MNELGAKVLALEAAVKQRDEQLRDLQVQLESSEEALAEAEAQNRNLLDEQDGYTTMLEQQRVEYEATI